MFDVHNFIRAAFVFSHAITAVHALDGIVQHGNVLSHESERKKTRLSRSFIFFYVTSIPVHHFLGIMLAVILWVQLLLLLYGCLWRWLWTTSLWGRLMENYTRTIKQLDVVRGRSVPAPSTFRYGEFLFRQE